MIGYFFYFFPNSNTNIFGLTKKGKYKFGLKEKGEYKKNFFGMTKKSKQETKYKYLSNTATVQPMVV